MSNENVRITCPACGKLTQLLHVTEGVTLFKTVGELIDNGITTRGFVYDGGEFVGYQCAECHKILAVDSNSAYKLIKNNIGDNNEST
jgi:phage FluMu protein Com